jgi:hypothetical protein
VIIVGGQLQWRSPVSARQFKVPSDGVMAEVFLGVTVTSLYTLVGLGIIVAFM